MSKGPGLYADIGKKAKDLLTKDYISDQKFSVSTCSDTGVAITSTAVKKGELSISDVAAQYKYKNTLIDVKLDTESNISTTLTITDIVPSTTTIASLKLPDYNSGKLEVRYFHHHAMQPSLQLLVWTNNPLLLILQQLLPLQMLPLVLRLVTRPLPVNSRSIMLALV
ncbi:Eukaryotic porin/Tom40 protein [Actinidia chinensis var. chinensis]|uniref:Eukaryotic porin/Tom40 protein n=1 Tax=Actinidia chinensis var. chinensis TaxID=1590841 RepID=A0A2R6R5E1_ACTCC|nr:Eukaryotic porin/Tom40 protein [Actinidia chinensis var. chinensis]